MRDSDIDPGSLTFFEGIRYSLREFKIPDENQNTSSGILNPQRGVLNPLSGIINPQEGYLTPLSGIINPLEKNLNISYIYIHISYLKFELVNRDLSSPSSETEFLWSSPMESKSYYELL